MTASGDTIVAVASGRAAAAIGVVRVSGPAVPGIAATLLGGPPQPRHAHLCMLADATAEPIDQGLVLYFPAPHSYTGEHMLEWQGHGNPRLLQRAAARLAELGARPARAGEFTERAFLNGKLDLAQAEAVADLIASGSDAAARAALRSLDGEFSRRVAALGEGLTRLRVWVEAAIDFAAEEIDFLADARLVELLATLRADLDALFQASRRGTRLAEGLHVVIVGRPNAGKSSLLNALAQREHAIVTELPGTTRDLLTAQVELDGLSLSLTDTAGLREAGDAIEREGIRRARAELARADLGLLVTDDGHAAADAALLAGLPAGAARLVVHNKIDLAGQSPRREDAADGVHLWLSARTGAGLDALRDELRRLAGDGGDGSGGFSARARHLVALAAAQTALDAAASALADGVGEIAAEELRQAQLALDELSGRVSSDDLLGRIFAGFCIGK
ncbi:MAG TPA: tRNA uridine-5-carboxymethylaminomethyl(34) synthesis GTPase MnmE [Rhodanobacteraceae bacterium]|nr:tRNA uridine-5-carboxymethylaminomethyl(34) synthesis GTPase MnmE [Rhodanobacteraceae bacterium]